MDRESSVTGCKRAAAPTEDGEYSDCNEPMAKRVKGDTDTKGGSAGPTPSLLGIPGELRNRIYELVLLPKKRCDRNVNKHPTQPGILMVNRQIRTEAKSIYYTNEFHLDIYELKLAPREDHWCWQSNARLFIAFKGAYRWDNFLVLLKKYHERDFVASVIAEIFEEEACFDTRRAALPVNDAFRLVEILRDDPWEKVLKTLHVYRGMVAKHRRHNLLYFL